MVCCGIGIVLLITRLYTEDSDDDGGSCSFNFPPILENSISEVSWTEHFIIHRCLQVKLHIHRWWVYLLLLYLSIALDVYK